MASYLDILDPHVLARVVQQVIAPDYRKVLTQSQYEDMQGKLQQFQVAMKAKVREFASRKSAS